MQDPVYPKANAVFGLIGLEVKVGGPAFDGIHHDLVDVFDDGGVVVSRVDAFVES